MRKHAKPNIEPSPRQIGDINVTPAVTKRRVWSKAPPSTTTQGSLWAEPQAKPAEKVPASVPETATADRSAGPEGEHRSTAAGGLFQSNGHCCDEIRNVEQLGAVVDFGYRLRPCKCKKWFCPNCGPGLGRNLRNRLLCRIKRFQQVFGVTLTIDGSLFHGPAEGWLYVMQNRLLARFVRDLRARELLHSPAYFWVVEFQQNEQPHWHLLLDASKIEHGILVEIWSRFRPLTATPLAEKITARNYKGHAPAFGSLRFTVHPEREKAAYYATKYLCKFSKDGYPAWVLDRVGRMPRYGHSHKFFPRHSGHDPSCFCEICTGAREAPAKARSTITRQEPSSVRRKQLKTIRERIERCADECVVVSVSRVLLPDGTIVDGKGRFVSQIKISYAEACAYFGLSPDEQWQIHLDGNQVTELEEYAAHGGSAGRAA